MAKVLAIETSTSNCSVSIQGDGIDVLIEENAPQQHAKLVLPMVDKALKEAQIQPEELDALIVGVGPGAFTGIRIGVGVVQGLALGWNKPVLALSSLLSMAYQGFLTSGELNWVSLLDARMQQVYSQNFEFNSQGELLSYTPSELVDLSRVKDYFFNKNIIGDALAIYDEFAVLEAQKTYCLPSAKPLALVGLAQIDKAKYLEEELPLPTYLREAV